MTLLHEIPKYTYKYKILINKNIPRKIHIKLKLKI